MDMSNVTGPVAPHLLKAIVILSDKLSEGLQLTKIHTENQKKATFLKEIKILITYKLFENFTKHRKKKTNRVVDFSPKPLPDIVQYKHPR